MALDFIAGCLGGCAGVAIGHPLDTVKVKLQTQDLKNPVYRGTWHCFTKILQTESLAGVYRGVWSPMCGVALVNAVVFGVYGNIQRNLTEPDSFRSQFFAGATAGLAQSIVSGPVELVKTRMQTSSSYQGTMDCFMNILRSEGLRGVFKGLSITGVRDFFGYGFYFATYEVVTRTSPGEAPVGTPTMLLAGGISGMVSWILTYPLDVIKTRYQADIGKYTGLIDCLKKSLQNEGVSCLSRGLMPTIIRAFPTNAVTFTVVAWVMRCADFSGNQSVSLPVKEFVDSVVKMFSREKHLFANTELVDEPVNNFKYNWLCRINTQKYFLMSEDFWVDGAHDFLNEDHENLLKINKDHITNENRLEADLLAAELKMFDDLAQETKESDCDFCSKLAQTKVKCRTE